MACDAIATIPSLICCTEPESKKVILCGAITGHRLISCSVSGADVSFHGSISETCNETDQQSFSRVTYLNATQRSLRRVFLPDRVASSTSFYPVTKWTSSVTPTEGPQEILPYPSPVPPPTNQVFCSSYSSRSVIVEGINETTVELTQPITDEQCIDEMVSILNSLPFPTADNFSIYRMPDVSAPVYSGNTLVTPSNCGSATEQTVAWEIIKGLMQLADFRSGQTCNKFLKTTKLFIAVKSTRQMYDGWCDVRIKGNYPGASFTAVESCVIGNSGGVFIFSPPSGTYPDSGNIGQRKARIAKNPSEQQPFGITCCGNPFV